MYIEFNVSFRGSHFFATDERSCTCSSKAEELKKVLLEKFPESEGYNVSASLNPQRYCGLDLSKDLALGVDKALNTK